MEVELAKNVERVISTSWKRKRGKKRDWFLSLLFWQWEGHQREGERSLKRGGGGGGSAARWLYKDPNGSLFGLKSRITMKLKKSSWVCFLFGSFLYFWFLFTQRNLAALVPPSRRQKERNEKEMCERTCCLTSSAGEISLRKEEEEEEIELSIRDHQFAPPPPPFFFLTNLTDGKKCGKKRVTNTKIVKEVWQKKENLLWEIITWTTCQDGWGSERERGFFLLHLPTTTRKTWNALDKKKCNKKKKVKELQLHLWN